MKTAQINSDKNFYVNGKLRRTRRKSPRRAFDASKFADSKFSAKYYVVYTNKDLKVKGRF